MVTKRREKIILWFSENSIPKEEPSKITTIKGKLYNIYTDILSETSYLPKKSNMSERLYHILNNIFDIKRCSCGKSLNYIDINKGYFNYCGDCGRKIKRTSILFNNEKRILCDYGCGQEAEYILQNKKYCCTTKFGKCPNIIKKCVHYGKDNFYFGKSIRRKYSLKEWLVKHPNLKKYEDLTVIENIDDIKVKCKHCEKWFTPTFKQLSNRMKSLECIENNKKGCGHDYFFCSDKCKFSSLFYYRKYGPSESESYREYRRTVDLKTQRTIKKYHDKIDNIDLRKYNSIDHKFSVRSGYDNNVSVDIISHWKNLEVISRRLNSKKQNKCSITLENLLDQINRNSNV